MIDTRNPSLELDEFLTYKVMHYRDGAVSWFSPTGELDDAMAVLRDWKGDVNISRRGEFWYVELCIPSMQWDGYNTSLPMAICEARYRAAMSGDS